jgi:NADH-dependent peroxiredoxin subunit C
MININSLVPDFEVESYQNKDIKKIKLSDYKGRWVILIFYPADFTFVCPTELEDAQKYYEEVKKTWWRNYEHQYRHCFRS